MARLAPGSQKGTQEALRGGQGGTQEKGKRGGRREEEPPNGAAEQKRGRKETISPSEIPVGQNQPTISPGEIVNQKVRGTRNQAPREPKVNPERPDGPPHGAPEQKRGRKEKISPGEIPDGKNQPTIPPGEIV